MKKLVIIAHPLSTGHSTRHASIYVEESQKIGHHVEYMNLYDSEYYQHYLTLNNDIIDPKKDLMHQKISRADQLVFFFPIWRFDCPAILKNRFDVNMSPGFAYKYKKNSLFPHQLLTGKTAQIFATAGGPTRLYYTIGATLRINFAIGRLGYCGIKLVGYNVFGNVHNHLPPEHEKRMEDTIRAKARK